MKNKYSYIAFAVALVGITCTTLGHYAEVWIIGYGVAIIFGILSVLVFAGDDK